MKREYLDTQIDAMRKEVLNFREACSYTGFSKSHLYKLTHKRLIPHYCRNGSKLLFFKREELDDWLLQGKRATIEEIEDETNQIKI